MNYHILHKMKLFIKMFFTIFFAATFLSCGKSKHKIGDIYKGGYVFKINIFGHGLCAAPKDCPKQIKWGCYGVLINGADEDKIGAGKQNTDDILAGCSDYNSFAAKACDELVVENYDDWYLPSIEELLLMQRELYTQSFGDFKDAEYWSSTQNFSLGAWKVDFMIGEKSNSANKSSLLYVRAIRSF